MHPFPDLYAEPHTHLINARPYPGPPCQLSAAREVLVEQEAGDVLLAGLAAIGLHFTFLAFNIVVTWLARFSEAERKARGGHALVTTALSRPRCTFVSAGAHACKRALQVCRGALLLAAAAPIEPPATHHPLAHPSTHLIAHDRANPHQAIIIMASQKNLPTAAVIISYFDASVGNLGLITIPCIVFYIMQARAWGGQERKGVAGAEGWTCRCRRVGTGGMFAGKGFA